MAERKDRKVSSEPETIPFCDLPPEILRFLEEQVRERKRVDAFLRRFAPGTLCGDLNLIRYGMADEKEQALSRLVEAYRRRWRMQDPEVVDALREKAGIDGVSPTVILRTALQTSIFLALGDDETGTTVRFGRTDWVVDGDGHKALVVPMSLFPDEYQRWIEDRVLHYANDWMVDGLRRRFRVLNAHSDGTSRPWDTVHSLDQIPDLDRDVSGNVPQIIERTVELNELLNDLWALATDAERETIELLGEGYQSAEIAEIRGTSQATVRVQKMSIREKARKVGLDLNSS